MYITRHCVLEDSFVFSSCLFLKIILTHFLFFLLLFFPPRFLHLDSYVLLFYFSGLRALHVLTSQRSTVLRIDLQDGKGSSAFAQYQTFHVNGVRDLYTKYTSGFHGTAGTARTTRKMKKDRAY